MATVKGRIPVRGTCKDGHVTEATSDAGRVTWEGTCAHDGCDLKVKARRVPGTTAPAGTPAEQAPKSSAGGDDPHRVIEVEFDRDDPEPGPRAGGTDDSEPGDGEGAPAGVEEAEPGEPRVVQPRSGGGRWKRRRPRLTRAERADARRQAAEQWVVPNIVPR